MKQFVACFYNLPPGSIPTEMRTFPAGNGCTCEVSWGVSFKALWLGSNVGRAGVLNKLLALLGAEDSLDSHVPIEDLILIGISFLSAAHQRIAR